MILRNGATEYKNVVGWKRFIAKAFECNLLKSLEDAEHNMVDPLTVILNGEVGSVKRGSKDSGPGLLLDLDKADTWLADNGATQQ